MNDKDDQKHDNLDEIEEKLILEEQEKRKIPMSVSGRSVFEIKRIKDNNKKD
ncbi:MAG: hypothetical protein WC536_02450 [Patescibacteria group bacterium]